MLDDLTDDMFVEIARKQRKEMNICKFLMNQKKISGVGNYILAEGLYKANICPWSTVDAVPEEQLRVLCGELRETAEASYKAQGLTRAKGGSFRNVDGQTGGFEFKLCCYGRQWCSRGEKVYKIVDGPHGRAIHFVKAQVKKEEIKKLLEE